MNDEADTAGHGGQDELRPVTYNDAEERYRGDLAGARHRYDELADRDLSARSAAILRERGEFDPGKLGHRLVGETQPLTAAERLEAIAVGEVLARYYRHPTKLDNAAKTGATWDQIAAARGTSADQARQDYREWADGQHHLLTWTEGRIGISDAEYAQAMARLADPDAAPLESAGQDQAQAHLDQAGGRSDPETDPSGLAAAEETARSVRDELATGMLAPDAETTSAEMPEAAEPGQQEAGS